MHPSYALAPHTLRITNSIYLPKTYFIIGTSKCAYLDTTDLHLRAYETILQHSEGREGGSEGSERPGTQFLALRGKLFIWGLHYWLVFFFFALYALGLLDLCNCMLQGFTA